MVIYLCNTCPRCGFLSGLRVQVSQQRYLGETESSSMFGTREPPPLYRGKPPNRSLNRSLNRFLNRSLNRPLNRFLCPNRIVLGETCAGSDHAGCNTLIPRPCALCVVSTRIGFRHKRRRSVDHCASSVAASCCCKLETDEAHPVNRSLDHALGVFAPLKPATNCTTSYRFNVHRADALLLLLLLMLLLLLLLLLTATAIATAAGAAIGIATTTATSTAATATAAAAVAG